jgi:hypothetical protein
MHSFIHFPPSSDTKAYTDTIPPTLHSTNWSTLSTYADACWGSQIGNAVANGTLLPLFKFRSMSRGIVFCNGSPLGWLGEHQNCTSLSSCEAEICATSATSKEIVDFRHLSCSMAKFGHALDDVAGATTLYNDNEAYVKWSYNMTTKGTCHIKLWEDLVWEWVKDKTLSVKHVSGTVNPADIFTKGMKDRAHFWCLWDSFISRLSDFNTSALLVVHYAWKLPSTNIILAAARAVIESGSSSYFLALASSSFCHTYTTMSHLSSAGNSFFKTSMVSFLRFFLRLLFFVVPPPFGFWPPPQFSLGINLVCFCFLVPFGCTDGGCWSVYDPSKRR